MAEKTHYGKLKITTKFRSELSFLLLGMAACVMSGRAATYYVATNGVDAAGRGSAESPFETIQYAIDAASANDKIRVMPGIYDKGGKKLTGYSYNLVNRLTIDKRLDIESTGGRDVTHIVGRHDPDGDKYGCGLNAVRCVGVSSDGVGSTLKASISESISAI